VHLLVLRRSAERALTADRGRRRTELERLALALAAHDPQRTLTRGYALVEDRAGEPLTSAAAVRKAGRFKLRLADDTVPSRVDEP
jgi:exodeoxyribonuclease VII large subunit